MLWRHLTGVVASHHKLTYVLVWSRLNNEICFSFFLLLKLSLQTQNIYELPMGITTFWTPARRSNHWASILELYIATMSTGSKEKFPPFSSAPILAPLLSSTWPFPTSYPGSFPNRTKCIQWNQCEGFLTSVAQAGEILGGGEGYGPPSLMTCCTIYMTTANI